MPNFDEETKKRIESNGQNEELSGAALDFMRASTAPQYSYNFTWMGHPIIQYPQDIVAMQELIWRLQPDLIVETGIARGGSLIFSAAMLELNAICGGPQDARVLGIDIDIRAHNKTAIEQHPMFKRIDMIEGSSVDLDIAAEVRAAAEGKKQVLVCLDSNHTHDHVLQELNLYASLATVGSYCVVFDTIIEDFPEGFYADRPWDKGNNPKTAVWEWLKSNHNFEIDKSFDNKSLITVAPDGFLKRSS